MTTSLTNGTEMRNGDKLLELIRRNGSFDIVNPLEIQKDNVTVSFWKYCFVIKNGNQGWIYCSEKITEDDFSLINQAVQNLLLTDEYIDPFHKDYAKMAMPFAIAEKK